MKHKALVFALMFFPILAQASDYEITVDRKKDALSQSHEGSIQHNSQNWVGEVKLTNHGFKDSPNLDLQYVVFVKRQDLGIKADAAEHVEKVRGSLQIPSVKGGATTTANTNEVKLRRQQLDPHTVFLNGGIGKAEDTVLGIWVRLSQGGKQVAEYVNPTTLTTKFKWE